MTRRSPRREDPLTYRIAYSLIAQELHAWSSAGSEPEPREPAPIPALRVREALAAVQREVPAPRLREATAGNAGLDRAAEDGPAEQARELVDEVREELLRLRHRWVGQRQSRFERLMSRRWSDTDSRLAAFLAHVVEPATVAMYFSVRVEEGRGAGLAPLPVETQPVDRRLRASDGEAFEIWLHDYLERIRRPEAQISYRARYNLACLFSRLAVQSLGEERPWEPYVDESTRQLELCVARVSGRRRAAIQAWAWRDPAFVGLKELRWNEFSRILGPQPEVR